MKTQIHLLLALLLAGAGTQLSAYDLDNRALTPVTHEETPRHAPLKLVENGELKFAIITDKKAEKNGRTGKSIAPAVKILTEAFKKTTGKTPEVFDITETGKAGKYPFLLVVGDNQIVRRNGIDFMKLPDQGFAVKSFPQGVIIAGHDSSLIEDYNRDPLDRRGTSPGTLYGAVDFTERILGIRYFYPGEYGTYYPQIKDLAVKPLHYTDYPRFNTHGARWYFWVAVSTDQMLKQWEPTMGKLKKYDTSFLDRWRAGGTAPARGGHCPRPEKMAKSYPDKLKTIFYTSPNGKFWYNPKQHIGNYYNVLDLGFADLLMDAYKTYYDSRGKTDRGGFASVLNNESLSFGICDTYMPLSEVIHDPVVRKLNLITENDIRRGKDAEMANVYGRFYQYLANRVKKELPGKKLWILAYYNTKFASLDPQWKLPDNVEVNLCIGGLPLKTRNRAAMEKARGIFKEWYEALGSRPVQKVWLYNSRNNPFARAVAGEFTGDVPKLFGKYLGRDGNLFFDYDGAHDIWYYYWSAYADARSQWNPDWDVDAGIDEHWNLFYGPEAGPFLKEFHRLLKKNFIEYCVPSDEAVPSYPPAEIDKMEKMLKEAEKVLEPDSIEMRRFRHLAAPWAKNFESQRVRFAYERPVYNVHRLLSGEKVTLDGNPDEAFWQKIKPLPLINPKGSSKAPAYPAVVKLAWDNSGIYGMFQADYPPKVDSKCDVWNNDSIEMFLAPGLKKEVKYQIAFDTVGQRFSAMERLLPIPQPTDLSWKAEGFVFKNQVSREGWTAEFHIPFHLFESKAPAVYDSWNFNLVRNKLSAPKECSGSSLTLGDNHNINMFGLIRFAGKGE